MDFKKCLFNSKFCIYTPIELSDSKSILEIRTERKDSALKKINFSIANQDLYYKSYYEKFVKNQEIYFKISLVNDKTPVGLVRITELNEEYRFNYHSLIFKINTPPFMPIDAIFSMYQLGFDLYNKDICGPWPVPKIAKKVYQLHKKMGIATEVMSNKEFFFFVVTKDKFNARKSYFKKLGFGLDL